MKTPFAGHCRLPPALRQAQGRVSLSHPAGCRLWLRPKAAMGHAEVPRTQQSVAEALRRRVRGIRAEAKARDRRRIGGVVEVSQRADRPEDPHAVRRGLCHGLPHPSRPDSRGQAMPPQAPKAAHSPATRSARRATRIAELFNSAILCVPPRGTLPRPRRDLSGRLTMATDGGDRGDGTLCVRSRDRPRNRPRRACPALARGLPVALGGRCRGFPSRDP